MDAGSVGLKRIAATYRRPDVEAARKAERGEPVVRGVFENHHEPIIDYPTFAYVQEQMKKRTRSNYNGIPSTKRRIPGCCSAGTAAVRCSP